MQAITIPFSKWKMGLIFLGNLFYGALGFVFLFAVLPFGILILGISIWYAWFSWRRLTGAVPGVLADSEGIENNSQWLSLGKIPWKDVKAIKPGRALFFYRVINVELRYPELNLSREKSTLKRLGLMWRKITFRQYVEIQPRLLSKSYNEVAKILMDIDIENPNFEDFSEHLIE